MASTTTYSDHFLACAIIHNIVTEHSMQLAHASGIAEAASNSASLLQVDPDADDESKGALWSLLLRKRPTQAANLDRYVRESAALSVAADRGDKIDADEADAAGGIDEASLDAVIMDTAAGATLRDTIFGQAGMATWSSSGAEERRKIRRAERMRARSNTTDI